jgi:PEP-CTERM motif
MNRLRGVPLAIAALGAFSVLAQAEVLNLFVPLPGAPGAPSFTMILKGNVVAAINAAAIANDPVVNPFAYVNQNILHNAALAAAAVSLDGMGNTDVIFSGPNPVLPTYSFNYGAGNGLPHVGLDGTAGAAITGNGPPLNVISDMWTTTPVFPSVSVVGPDVTGPSVSYGIVFADVTSGPFTVGEWFELPFNGGTVPTFRFVNNTVNPITLSNVGFFVTNTFTALDNLNFGQTPPPDQAGSPFHPISQDNGITLSPGGSTDVVPEPSTFGLLSMSVAGFCAIRRWSGRRAPQE